MRVDLRVRPVPAGRGVVRWTNNAERVCSACSASRCRIAEINLLYAVLLPHKGGFIMEMNVSSITCGREAVEYIHSFSWMGSRPGLERTTALLNAIENPERELKFVHVVGTNGKGSISAMIASMLTAQGKCTGLYTSPFIRRFHERMMVNGREITDEELTEVTRYVGEKADALDEHPTEFELVTCIALEYYRRKHCDYVVLEAGMGGRLDSTNAIPAPEVVVITNIGLDHTGVLGDTVEAIAAEKAAVIKPGCQVVLYRQSESVMDVVKRICEERSAALHIAGVEELELRYDTLDGQGITWKGVELVLPLLGEHQRHNAAVALKVADVLGISEQAIERGLAAARWPGRFEILSRDPWFIVDGGHNPQCAETVAYNLNHYFPGKKAVILMGVLADKDFGEVCAIVEPYAQQFVTVTPDSYRAMPAEDLAGHLARYGKPVTVCASVQDGVRKACELAGEGGLVCAFGSLYMTGEIRACFGFE